MPTETKLADEWECFQDAAYFDMHCVRLDGVRTFGMGFHLADREEAKALCDLLNTRTAKTYEQGLEDCLLLVREAQENIFGPTTRQAVLTELDNNIRALAKGDV